jgi:hypothetical protein
MMPMSLDFELNANIWNIIIKLKCIACSIFFLECTFFLNVMKSSLIANLLQKNHVLNMNIHLNVMKSICIANLLEKNHELNIDKMIQMKSKLPPIILLLTEFRTSLPNGDNDTHVKSEYTFVMLKQSPIQGKIDTTAVTSGRAPPPPNYILSKSQPDARDPTCCRFPKRRVRCCNVALNKKAL